MLAIRLRVRPCSARLSRSSSDRVTSTCRAASSYRTPISGRNVYESLPLGPSTWIVESATETFTLAGTGTGFRPIRDMGRGSSRFEAPRGPGLGRPAPRAGGCRVFGHGVPDRIGPARVRSVDECEDL